MVWKKEVRKRSGNKGKRGKNYQEKREGKKKGFAIMNLGYMRGDFLLSS